MKKYFIINVAKKPEVRNFKADCDGLIEAASHSLKQHLNFKIDATGKITLFVSQPLNNAIADLSQAKLQLNKASSDYQWLVEYDEASGQVTAIYDPYFAINAEEEPHKVELNYLFLKNRQQATENINGNVLFDSLAYGLLKNIANHHPALAQYYQRCIALGDYLAHHPLKKSYGIINKEIDSKKLVDFYLRKKSPLTPLQEGKINELMAQLTASPIIPQINYDDFIVEDMLDILRNYGSFELVGPAIERLKIAAQAIMQKSKQILALPLDVLEAIGYEDFHGFQDFRKRTDKGPIRNQIGYHFKPYKTPRRAPAGIENIKEFDDYYDQGMAILRSLYRKIAITSKMDPKRLSNFANDALSVISIRKYFDDGKGETGIPSHSDLGLLTLVVSDAPGLEIKKGDQWLPAAHTPGLRFYVNIGDWFLFQLGESMRTTFRTGIHRVPQGQLKHSVVLFMNPDNNEEANVRGEVKNFKTFARTRVKD